MLRIAASSTLVMSFMAQVALAQSGSGSGSSNMGSKFADCVCYNQGTNSFCHGSEWYNSQACQDWIAADFGWVLFIFAVACLMMAFPFLFCCSRFCCQCCGGRHPTRGCCCSDTSTQAIFPGYTNRSIAFTRASYVVGFCLALATTLVTWGHNNSMNTAVSETIGVAQTGVQQLQQYATAVNSVAAYVITPNNYMSTLAVNPVDMGTIDTVNHAVNSVNDGENNAGYGRKHLTTVISFWALVVPVVAFIPMACSWRSSMNVFLIFHCIIATVILIAVMPLGAISEVVSESCDNWYATQTFLTGALQSAGVGSTSTQMQIISNYMSEMLAVSVPTESSASASSATGSATGSAGANSGVTTLCADIQAVCFTIGGCQTTPCTASNANNYGCADGVAQSFNSYPSFNQQMSTFLNSVCPGKTTSIAMLAQSNAKAQAIVAFSTAVSGFEHVYDSNQYSYMGVVTNMMMQIQWPLCSRVRGHAKNVAISVGVQYLVALVMLVAMFLGIKRFAKWNSYNPYAEYMTVMQEPTTVITAIVVEINNDAPWSPSPNGYGAPSSPVAGYTETTEAC